MKNTLNESQFLNKYQQHLAKMTHSFLIQTLDKKEDEVKIIYESFCNEWERLVEKVNAQYGGFVLAHGSWRNIFERDGYRNIITKPIAPEEKASILRIIFIVEGKTEFQRALREFKYKYIFLIVRIKYWWRKLPFWKENRQQARQIKNDIQATQSKMSVVK